MAAYKKPERWAEPKNKLFPHQVGFTCPPFDYDAAPSDFLRICPDTVGVHGWMLHVPDYAHGLDQRREITGLLQDFEIDRPPVRTVSRRQEQPHQRQRQKSQ